MSDLAAYTTNTGQEFTGTFVEEGKVGPIGPKGDPGEKGDKGEKPIRGIDYFTQDDINQMVYRITDDANSVFNENVAEKTADFNTNASNKTTDFNTNATNKTNAYDGNASDKVDTYNTNASTKTSAFNDNYDTKLADFNSNATDKTSAYNTNATGKLDDYNSNATSKTTAFNNNATSKTTTFNTNASSKTTDFNDNASSKTTAFDENAAAKKQDFDDNAASYADRLDDLEAVTGTGTDTFSTDSTYSVGDIVVYDNKVYRCVTAITTAGAWDSTKWEELSVRQELDEKETRIKELEGSNNLIISNYNTDTVTGSDLDITDALNGYNQGIAVAGQVTQDGTPTPDNPSPIIDVTGIQEVVVRNRNLWSLNGFEDASYTDATTPTITSFDKKIILGYRSNNGYVDKKLETHTIDGDKITITTKAYTHYGVGITYKLEPGTYILSFLKSNASGEAYINFYDNNGVRKSSTADATFTVTDYTNIIIAFAINATNATCEFSNIQLEKGSTATDYVPHKGLTTTLHLGDIYLGNLFESSNTLIRRSDKKWYWHKEWNKRIINGTENWIRQNDVFALYFGTGIKQITAWKTAYVIRCDAYRADLNMNRGELSNYRICKVTGANTQIAIRDDRFTTADEFKTDLSNNPRNVAYILAISTDIEITSENYPELYSDLQKLEETQTYREHTIITVTPETGNPAQLEVTYLKDDRVSKEDFELLKARVDLLEE